MNDDDRILIALGRRARQEDGLDGPEWDALGRDDLPDEERAKLEARPPPPGAGERAFEVLRPLDAGERAAIADAVLARLDAGPPASEAPANAAEPASDAAVLANDVAEPANDVAEPANDAAEPANDAAVLANDVAPRRAAVVPLRAAARGRGRLLAWLALAAALGVAVWFGARSLSQPPALASYHLRAKSGDATHLGEPEEGEIRLAPGSRWAVTLEPEAAVDGAIAIESFLVADGHARPWEAPLLRRAGGALRLEGTREALFEGIADGRWEVVFFVARPASMAARDALVGLAEGREQEVPAGVQVLRARLWLVPGKGSRAEPGPARVELAGCASAGSVCEVRPGRPLVVWVEARSGVEIAVDGRAQSPTPAAVQSGQRFTVQLDRPASELRVTVSRDGVATLVNVKLGAQATSPALEEAIAAGKRGDAAAAAKLLAEVEQSGLPALRLQAHRQRARLALRRGDPAAEQLLRDAIQEGHALGRAGDEAEDRFALSYRLLFGARRIDEARATLDGAVIAGAAGAETAVGRAYYLGLASLEVGDLRGALASLGDAEKGAERLGLDDMRGAALDVISEALATLGRSAESIAAAEQARELVPADAQPCERARGASNFGWALFRAGGSPARRDESLREALDVARAGCPSELGHVLTNVAIAEHASGRVAEARRVLEEAREASASPDPRHVVWWRALAGRVALAEGRPAEARAELEALVELGRSALLPEAIFEGQLGRAEALVALGDEPGARAAYRETDAALSAWGSAVPLGEGREAFLTAHGRAAQSELRALVTRAERAEKAGDPRADALRREGAESARRVASRLVLAHADVSAAERLPKDAAAAWSEAVGRYRAQRALIEEKAAWTERDPRAAEARAALRSELDRALSLLGSKASGAPAAPPAAAPAADELHLAFASLGASWVAFATTAEATLLQRLDAPPIGEAPASIAALLRDPLRDALRRSKRVRIVSDGPGSGLDFQTLPLDGAPLLASHTVVYGLDTPAPEAQEARDGRVAYVVVDPTRDAPAVRATGALASEALARSGFQVERIDGADATHAAVRAALERPDVELFYYAGHAVFEGLDGELAGLRLAGDARLTVSDILLLERVPRQIVLLACEGGRTGGGGASGLGIAQAFLLRGAGAAVAAPRPVEDAMTARLGAALTSALSGGRTVADALAAAQAALYREVPAEVARADGWSAFRAWVR